MAGNGKIIASMVGILFVILIVGVLCGCLAWAGGCNIAGVTFNSTTARDSLPAMLGNAFWGWVVCPMGLISIGLLGYASYRVIDDSRKKMNTSDYKKLDEKPIEQKDIDKNDK
jgi:hypothetical protein